MSGHIEPKTEPDWVNLGSRNEDEIPHDVLTNKTIAWFDQHAGCLKIGDLQPGTIAMIVADLLKARGYTITAPAAADGATGAEGDGR